MANTVDKVINIAQNEVGYLEKKSNSQLDSKTANAGSANYTKYGKNMGCNGLAWCDAFVDDCFVQAYGREKAKELLGGFSNYTPTSAQYFKDMGRWHTTNPQVGDQIFFKNSTRICHTGIVYKVDSSNVYTIEGNTSGASGVIANGGGVCRKSYPLTYSKIAGYGRPDYDNAASSKNTSSAPLKNTSSTSVSNTNTPQSSAYSKKQFILDVQAATGAKTDGIAGSETLSKTITVSRSKNRTHKVVKALQKYLNSMGYNCGTVDGIAGVKFDAAVKAYQRDKGCVVDGEITAGKNTWKTLLGLRK